MSVYSVDKTTGDLHIVANLHAEPATSPTTTDMSRIGIIAAFGIQPLDEHWCLCDGSPVDPAVHPILATYTSNFPDMRECVPVGAGENSTATIAVHDVYAVGEFKDDQVQEHTHIVQRAVLSTTGIGNAVGVQSAPGIIATNATTISGTTGRFGDTTHGKQVGVLYYMYADL